MSSVPLMSDSYWREEYRWAGGAAPKTVAAEGNYSHKRETFRRILKKSNCFDNKIIANLLDFLCTSACLVFRSGAFWIGTFAGSTSLATVFCPSRS